MPNTENNQHNAFAFDGAFDRAQADKAFDFAQGDTRGGSGRKGHTNNPNGRPKGSLNKATAELKDNIKALLTANDEKLRHELERLTGEAYVKSHIALLKYAIPTMQASREEMDFEDMTDRQLEYLIECLKHNRQPLASEWRELSKIKDDERTEA